MIDYEKLKIAEELCEKNDGYYFKITVDSSCGLGRPLLCNKDSYDEDFNNIDDLIAKLQELSKPEPKYKVGQTVYICINDNIISFVINEIIKDIDYFYIFYTDEGDYIDDGRSFDQYIEDELYPSREALIQAKIDYWKHLKQEHCEHCYSSMRYESVDGGAGLNGILCCSNCGKDKPDRTLSEEKSTRSDDMSKVCNHKFHFDCSPCECNKISTLNEMYISSTVCIDCNESIVLEFIICNQCGKHYKRDSGICEHQSDGNMRLSMPPQYKCIKCGAFYR